MVRLAGKDEEAEIGSDDNISVANPSQRNIECVKRLKREQGEIGEGHL